MASSSIAKQNLNAVIASQIRCYDDHDRLNQTGHFQSDDSKNFKDMNTALLLNSRPKSGQFSTDVVLSPVASPSPNGGVRIKLTQQLSHDCHFDSNNNSINNSLAGSLSNCQSPFLEPPAAADINMTPSNAKQSQQRKLNKRRREREISRESLTSSLNDVTSSSSPSCKRKKSPACDSNQLATANLLPTRPNSAASALLRQNQKNHSSLPDTTTASFAGASSAASALYETTVTGKKKGTKGSLGPSGARRNERERNRVKQVNLGFDRLREHVPQGRQNKKLSKVDTLKAAVSYIQQLQQILGLTDEFLANNQNFLSDCSNIAGKLIDEDIIDDDSDSDSGAFRKPIPINANEAISKRFDFNDGLVVLANASCLAEKENLFADDTLLAVSSRETKQDIAADFNQQSSFSDHYYIGPQPNMTANAGEFLFQSSSLLNTDTTKLGSNELQLEELISCLSSQQQDELLMGALKGSSLQLALSREDVPAAPNSFAIADSNSLNFMVDQHQSSVGDGLMGSFQTILDQQTSHLQLLHQQPNDKFGSLLEVLMNENAEEFLSEFKTHNHTSDGRHQFQHFDSLR